jgi:hypothetical protein
MSKTKLSLSFLLFLAACSSTSNTTTKPVPPQPKPVVTAPSCEKTGPELFGVRTLSKVQPTPDGVRTGELIVLRSGAWTATGLYTADGTARSGCLSGDDLATVMQTLDGLPLQVVHPDPSQPRCMAEAITNTVFAIDGAHVFTEELCSGVHIDSKSRTALDDVQKLMTAITMA